MDTRRLASLVFAASAALTLPVMAQTIMLSGSSAPTSTMVPKMTSKDKGPGNGNASTTLNTAGNAVVAVLVAKLQGELNERQYNHEELIELEA